MTHVPNSVPVLKTSRASTARKRKRPRKREKDPITSQKKSEGEKSTVPRLILNPSMVQNFIYVYINEKLKTEKLALQVDDKF